MKDNLGFGTLETNKFWCTQSRLKPQILTTFLELPYPAETCRTSGRRLPWCGAIPAFGSHIALNLAGSSRRTGRLPGLSTFLVSS
jgi:hypothetical protein